MTVRAFIPSPWDEHEIETTPEESHHLLRVVRIQRNDVVEVLDGCGHLGQARVIRTKHAHVILRVESVHEVPRPTPPRILAQALLKGRHMDWIIQKATELGVQAIQPLACDHNVVKLTPRQAVEKIERWRKIAMAAVKQSGNPWLPEIRPVASPAELIENHTDDLLLWASLHPGRSPLGQVLQEAHKPHQAVCVLIGPEGDFSAAEIALLDKASNTHPVSLGPYILRAETAAITAMALTLPKC